jgi:hypothetical protein
MQSVLALWSDLADGRTTLNTEKRWPSFRNVVKGMNLVENEGWALQYICSCRQFDLPAVGGRRQNLKHGYPECRKGATDF